MAKKTKSTTKPLGLALMVIGAGLVYWGHLMSGSVSSQITQAIEGAAPEPVMIRYIGGAVSFVVGLYLFFKK